MPVTLETLCKHQINCSDDILYFILPMAEIVRPVLTRHENVGLLTGTQ